MIKNVLFDFGNVFVYWDPYAAFEDKYSKSQVDEFFEAVNWRSMIERWDSGESHQNTLKYIESIDRKEGSNWAEFYQYYIPRFDKTLNDKVPGMKEIVLDLKQKGINVYGLTNWAYEDISIAKNCVEAIGLMQGIVVSGEEKITKPDPRIFQIAIDRFNLVPEETVFIDDRFDNVETAKNMGFNAIPFYEGDTLDDVKNVLGPQIAPANIQINQGLGAKRFRQNLIDLGVL